MELMWKFFTSVVHNEKDNGGAEVCEVELMWKFFTSVVRNEKDNSGAEVCESEINVEILHIFRT